MGPELRAVCGIVDDDGPAEIRRKITERLEGLASGLPEDLRVALLAAFGIEAEARLPFYQDRVPWAAEKIHRDGRTARRRIDEAIDRVAGLASSGTTSSAAMGHDASPSGWHTEELSISVVLDQSVPEVLECRRIVAERDHLTEIDLAMTGIAEFRVDVFYGGTLVRKERETSDYYSLILALPEALPRASRHDFALRVRFKLQSRRVPAAIFELKEKFQRDVDDPTPTGEIIPSNAAGEVHVVFHQLVPGRAYGIRWIP